MVAFCIAKELRGKYKAWKEKESIYTLFSQQLIICVLVSSSCGILCI
jgi:hypothetical protein